MIFQVRSALLDPPPFDPSKLTIRYLAGASRQDHSSGRLPWPRRYTLTHNDITGSLQLSIGSSYNQTQLSGWYTRILRDEVLAEWKISRRDRAGETNSQFLKKNAEVALLQTPRDRNKRGGVPVLHVYCHVSGEELWPAPPALRSFIFQREMRLVLDTIAYADRRLLASHPSLAEATVYVHLLSDTESLNRIIEWGSLGNKETWRRFNEKSWMLEPKHRGSQLMELLVTSFLEPLRATFSKWDQSAAIFTAYEEGDREVDSTTVHLEMERSRVSGAIRATAFVSEERSIYNPREKEIESNGSISALDATGSMPTVDSKASLEMSTAEVEAATLMVGTCGSSSADMKDLTIADKSRKGDRLTVKSLEISQAASELSVPFASHDIDEESNENLSLDGEANARTTQRSSSSSIETRLTSQTTYITTVPSRQTPWEMCARNEYSGGMDDFLCSSTLGRELSAVEISVHHDK